MTEKDMELFRDIQEQALQVKLNIQIGHTVCSWMRKRVDYIMVKAEIVIYLSISSANRCDLCMYIVLLVKVFLSNP